MQPLSVGGVQFQDMSGIENDSGKLWQLDKLKILRTFECVSLEEFPLGVSNLVAPQELDFGRCWASKSMQISFGNLTKL